MTSRRTPSHVSLLLLVAVAAGCTDAELPTALTPSLGGNPPAACAVTTTVDDVTDGGSLRALLADVACPTITFAVTGTITLGGSQLDIDRNVTITGPGAVSLTVSGNGESRVFLIGPDVEVTMSELTIAGGSIFDAGAGGGIYNDGTLALAGVRVYQNIAGFGGGILNNGTLTLTGSTVAGNTAFAFTTGIGGGILNNGSLTLTNSTISGNSTPPGGGGGGIYNAATASLSYSTVSGNSASDGGGGGGIVNSTDALMVLSNTTVSGNIAADGGGIANVGALTLTSSTVSANSAEAAAGIRNYATLTLTSSIVAGNVGSSSADLDLHEDATVAATYSLIGSSDGNDLVHGVNGNIVGVGVAIVDAKLGALADNGGATHTRALLSGSPAIDAGICAAGITADQRGISRPQGAGCDIGAFELEPAELAFDFSGFLAPVVAAPGLNVAKAGRVIPINFSLGGDQGLAVLDGVPTSLQIVCALAQGTSAVEESATAGKSALTYDAATRQYSYAWKSEKAWAGTCRAFTLTLIDGSTQTAHFQFTR